MPDVCLRCHEVAKFSSQLSAAAYAGGGLDRAQCMRAIKDTDGLLVVSYEALRNDLQRYADVCLTYA